ncbi:hypothetical protein DB44_FL00410 [Candidatus Protochlamydia amoebophila]|uniref:Uncharacterized protein n=1 Tax=Candidatus Protochlamydia amoebophila TaxID=362787 RepID=A0A0C1JJU1_9BACT|nr:hypothetical protein DB44_FL00410 [Candidatus Protochlamydia amoebophila]
MDQPKRKIVTSYLLLDGQDMLKINTPKKILTILMIGNNFI